MESLRCLLGTILVSLGVIGLILSPASAHTANPQSACEPPPQLVRRPGSVLMQDAVTRVEPTYPPLAKAARVSGAVVVEVTVDEQGRVISARATSGHPLLKDAAVAAARGWTFTPTELSGGRTKVIGTLTFNFTLPDDNARSDDSDESEIEEARKSVNALSRSPFRTC